MGSGGLRTVAGVLVLLELHEVGAGTGERLVVVDEAQVRAGPSATVSSTRVGSCERERKRERERI